MKWLDKLLGRKPEPEADTLPLMDSDLPELSDSARGELREYIYRGVWTAPDTGDEKQGVP